jgi:hypothetical protein
LTLKNVQKLIKSALKNNHYKEQIMFDDTNENQQLEQTQVEETQQESADQILTEQVAAKPTPQVSFRQLREQKDRLQSERDEAIRLLQQYQHPKQQSEPEDEDIGLGESDLAEGRHITKVGQKIKKLEEQVRKYQEESQLSALQIRIQSQFPDFDQVVNSENVQILKEQHPEIANALQSTPDIYNKAASAYKLIKQFGIYHDHSQDSNKQAVKNNFNKPRPSNSLSPQQGNSPLSQANSFANGLTDEVKTQLYKEMNQYRKDF